MNKLLGMIQDNNGVISSTRTGKMILILCYAYNWIMHIQDAANVPEPSMVLTAAVLGVIGIGVTQKVVENGSAKPKKP